MRIDPRVAGVNPYSDVKQGAAAKTDTKDSTTTKENSSNAASRTDTVTIGASNEPTKSLGTYNSKTVNKVDAERVAQLIADSEKRTSDFKKMIQSMIAKQGEVSNLAFNGLKLHVTLADSEKAQKSISPGGEYSVDAVAGRIVDMAKALSGGDKSKIAELKDAVIKGFGEASKAFGQKMPQITNDTYDEVMKRFDAWENEGKTVDTEA